MSKKSLTFGKLLISLRERLGMTPAEFADAIGRGRQTVCQSEERETNLGVKMLAELVRLGAATPDEAFQLARQLPWPPPKPGPKEKARKRQGGR